MPVDRKDDKKKLSSRMNAIKGYLEKKQQRVQQDVNNYGDSFFDKANSTTHNLGSIGADSSKKLGKSNVFEDLVELLSTSIYNDNVKISNNPKKFHLKNAALQAAYLVGTNLKQIVRDEFLRGLYVSTQLGCGVDSNITTTQIRIKPSEFDIFEMLKINPDSNIGKVIYESDKFEVNPSSLNQMFYLAFNGITYDVFSLNNNLLFSIKWEQSSQSYLVTNVMNKNVYNLIVEYFVTINIFDNKNLYGAIVAILSGVLGKSTNKVYINNMSSIQRMISKVQGYCEEKKGNDLKSDNLKEFEDLPYEVIDLFDFDDVEGLFLEEEDNRNRGVVKYADCGNLEVPVDEARVEEFFEDFNRNSQNETEHVNNFLNDIAYTTFQQTNGSIPIELIKININKNYIKTIPKALAHLLMTPKVIFPFVLIRRIFGSSEEDGKTLIKSIFKIIYRIIRRVFEEYVAEFFRLIKKEIIRLINDILADATSELVGKRTVIIKQLISIFKNFAAGNISSCGGLTRALLGLLSTNIRLPFSIPTPLLLAASQRSGFSNVRAFINVIEELDKVGIPTGDLYGQPNKYILQHLAHIIGVERERDENGVINGTIITGTVPYPSGVIIPGTIRIVGING